MFLSNISLILVECSLSKMGKLSDFWVDQGNKSSNKKGKNLSVLYHHRKKALNSTFFFLSL